MEEIRQSFDKHDKSNKTTTKFHQTTAPAAEQAAGAVPFSPLTL